MRGGEVELQATVDVNEFPTFCLEMHFFPPLFRINLRQTQKCSVLHAPHIWANLDSSWRAAAAAPTAGGQRLGSGGGRRAAQLGSCWADKRLPQVLF